MKVSTHRGRARHWDLRLTSGGEGGEARASRCAGRPPRLADDSEGTATNHRSAQAQPGPDGHPRDWVHGFAEQTVRRAAAEWDEREETPCPIIQEAAEIGLYSLEESAQSLDR